MLMKSRLLLLLALVFVYAADPLPPHADQFYIATAKPGERQYMVDRNWVDRIAGLWRIDIKADGELFEQGFYYGKEKTGYIIYYGHGKTECTIYEENYCDSLREWQAETKYAGVTKCHSDKSMDCHIWNKTRPSYTFSWLSTVKDNTPVEILNNGILNSLFVNWTTGPSAVPKDVFDFPMDKSKCKKHP